MGSQALQGKLWGRQAQHWADIQEPTAKSGYDFVLNALTIRPSTRLLDVGCGTGLFSKMAADKGATVTAIDATPEFIEITKKRVPSANVIVGEMEDLPFDDKSFDIVCGFNSFQYAANTKNALVEAKRVLADNGNLVTMIWGNKKDCEATSYLQAVGSLLPPPPPGAPGPFALSENNLLENILKEIGFTKINVTDVESIWDYPDAETALQGLLSAGPATKAIENSGYEKAYDTVATAMQPYIQSNGHVVYRNKWRVVISENS